MAMLSSRVNNNHLWEEEEEGGADYGAAAGRENQIILRE